MLVCYVDEAGDTGVLPSATSPIQPLFCIAGLVFRADRLATLTHEFLNLKRRYFPKRLLPNRPRLEQILVEVKGVDLRTAFRQPDRRKQRHHIGFLDRAFDLVAANNHAGLQLADLLVSALLFPMAAHTYCSGYVTNVHVHPGYAALCVRYGRRLRDLQYRYKDPATGYWHGGLVVADPVRHRNATHLFNHH